MTMLVVLLVTRQCSKSDASVTPPPSALASSSPPIHMII